MPDFKPITGYCESLLQKFDNPPDTRRQEDVIKFWRAHYPQYVAHTHLILLRDGRLIIFCYSSAVASRLRLEKNTIHSQLMGQNLSVSSVDIKVAPNNRITQRKKKPKPELSEQSANLIKQTASNVTHAPLQKALHRLGEKYKKD